VQNERNRDEAMDRLLRQRLAGPIDSGIASGACLDGEALAAWSEGSLPASDAARIESHVSQCARCQAVFAVFARTAPPLPEAESRWQRWRLQWLVPIAATATALDLGDGCLRHGAEAVQDGVHPAELHLAGRRRLGRPGDDVGLRADRDSRSGHS